jgi:hypothetical protein
LPLTISLAGTILVSAQPTNDAMHKQLIKKNKAIDKGI